MSKYRVLRCSMTGEEEHSYIVVMPYPYSAPEEPVSLCKFYGNMLGVPVEATSLEGLRRELEEMLEALDSPLLVLEREVIVSGSH